MLLNLDSNIPQNIRHRTSSNDTDHGSHKTLTISQLKNVGNPTRKSEDQM